MVTKFLLAVLASTAIAAPGLEARGLTPDQVPWCASPSQAVTLIKAWGYLSQVNKFCSSQLALPPATTVTSGVSTSRTTVTVQAERTRTTNTIIPVTVEQTDFNTVPATTVETSTTIFTPVAVTVPTTVTITGRPPSAPTKRDAEPAELAARQAPPASKFLSSLNQLPATEVSSRCSCIATQIPRTTITVKSVFASTRTITRTSTTTIVATSSSPTTVSTTVDTTSTSTTTTTLTITETAATETSTETVYVGAPACTPGSLVQGTSGGASTNSIAACEGIEYEAQVSKIFGPSYCSIHLDARYFDASGRGIDTQYIGSAPNFLGSNYKFTVPTGRGIATMNLSPRIECICSIFCHGADAFSFNWNVRQAVSDTQPYVPPLCTPEPYQIDFQIPNRFNSKYFKVCEGRKYRLGYWANYGSFNQGVCGTTAQMYGTYQIGEQEGRFPFLQEIVPITGEPQSKEMTIYLGAGVTGVKFKGFASCAQYSDETVNWSFSVTPVDT